MTPLFEAAIIRLVGSLSSAPKRTEGTLATELPIARTRYTLSAEATGEWIKFPVEAITVFRGGRPRGDGQDLGLAAQPSRAYGLPLVVQRAPELGHALNPITKDAA